jgi:hypothetical protein
MICLEVVEHATADCLCLICVRVDGKEQFFSQLGGTFYLSSTFVHAHYRFLLYACKYQDIFSCVSTNSSISLVFNEQRLVLKAVFIDFIFDLFERVFWGLD